MTETPFREAAEGVPLAEAAFRLGISERTLRKRIKAGAVKAKKVVTPQGGAAFRVFLNDTSPGPSASEPLPSQTFRPAEAPSEPSESGLGELVQLLRERDQMVREQQQTILELAGRTGWLQAKLQEAETRVHDLEEQVKLLSAPPSEPTSQVISEMDNHPTAPENGAVRGAEKGARPWWKFWEKES